MKTATFIVLTLSLLTAQLAGAQDTTATSSDCQLRVTTGKRGKGFSSLFRDIRRLCGTQVQLCEVESEGGLQNTVALSANEADLGFVQVDTLLAMKRSDENIASLQAVIPVNANLLHILVQRQGYLRKSERGLVSFFKSDDKPQLITKLSELKGLPVALVGSAQLLGRTLDRAFGLRLRISDLDSDEQALAALKTGEVAAVLYMNGWPSTTLDTLAREDSIVLAAYDLPMQAPYLLMHKNYPKLGAFNLPFLAAPNLLVTRPFKPEGTRGRQVAVLQRCIVRNLDALREGAFEPAWKEIKDPEDGYGWARFGVVETPASVSQSSASVLNVSTPSGNAASSAKNKGE